MKWKIVCVLAACAVALAAQTPPVTILEVVTENFVQYVNDVADPSKMATSAGIVPLPSGLPLTFKPSLGIRDMVSVNGKPAKGSVITRHFFGSFSVGYTATRAIADFSAGGATDTYIVVQQSDGTDVGIITATGFCGMAIPPGAPPKATAANWSITGGTGAFLGMRGQVGVFTVASARWASMLEDPANRRVHGGGKQTFMLHLIPMSWPEVVAVPTGPAVFHADDFSPVTAEKPARAGEQLIMRATGLGPVRPNLGPGKPFPPYPEGQLHEVNSPVEVTVNGKDAKVINKYGWPATTNVYRVDFVVPDGTVAGMAILGLSVAWINGPEVKFPVR